MDLERVLSGPDNSTVSSTSTMRHHRHKKLTRMAVRAINPGVTPLRFSIFDKGFFLLMTSLSDRFTKEGPYKSNRPICLSIRHMQEEKNLDCTHLIENRIPESVLIDGRIKKSIHNSTKWLAHKFTGRLIMNNTCYLAESSKMLPTRSTGRAK